MSECRCVGQCIGRVHGVLIIKKNSVVMKHLLNSFFCVFMTIVLAGCGDDSGKGGYGGTSGKNGVAPDDPTGKEFVFYPMEKGEWRFRVLPVDIQSGDAIILTNSSTSMVDKPHCYYKKEADGSASMSLNYNSYVVIGSSTIGRYHTYDLKLTFTSANQGLYTGSVGVGGIGDLEYQSISGIFTYDSDSEPNWEEGGQESGDSNEGGQDNVSSALGVEISSVSANDYYRQHSITVSLIEYEAAGLPGKVGFCLGVSPGVTIDNALIVREESAEYLNGFSTVLGGYTTEVGILKSGTRYYIRPYHRSGNEVTYYKETSVETLGGEITLDLRNNLIHIYEFAYDIKKEGSYSFFANFRIHGANGDFFYNKEYGVRTDGSGTVIIDIDDIPYSWDEIHCFWGNIKDLSTGIVYTPPLLNGGAGDPCL